MQQQKQQVKIKQPELALGLRAIAVINLIFGVPLAVVLLVAFLREPVPKDTAGWLFGGLAFSFVFGLNAAGVCLLLKQKALARAFQWLTAVGAALYLAMVVLTLVDQGLKAVPLLVLVPAIFVALVLIALAALLERFGED